MTYLIRRFIGLPSQDILRERSDISVLRVEVYSVLRHDDRIIEPALPSQQLAELNMRIGVRRIQFGRPPQRLLGAGEIADLSEQVSEMARKMRVVGLDGDSLTNRCGRLFKSPLTQKMVA